MRCRDLKGASACSPLLQASAPRLMQHGITSQTVRSTTWHPRSPSLFHLYVSSRGNVNITGPVGGAIGITKEQWEGVNNYPDSPVLLDRDHGTGQYLASLDVFHQLHCVDLLRKSIHREYYDKHEGSFAGAPEAVVQGHLEHCVETLRQTLMCHGDISLLTYNWVEGREMPYPNFNTVHTCKKWDTLIDWNMNRDVTVEWVDGVGRKVLTPPLKPNGVTGLKSPP